MTDARLAGARTEVLTQSDATTRLAGMVVEVLVDSGPPPTEAQLAGFVTEVLVETPISTGELAGFVTEVLASPDVSAALGGMVVEVLTQEHTAALLGGVVMEVLMTAPVDLPGGFDGSDAATRGPLMYAVPMTPGAVEGDPDGYLEPMVPLASCSFTHQLTGSSLPGQVLAPSGLAVASGSLTFAQPPAWSTEPVVTPWGNQTLWTDIGQFSIWAVTEEPATLADLLETGGELMRCIGRPVSGALSDPGVSVEFDQLVAGGKEEAVWTDWPRVTFAHSPADDPYTLGTLLSQAFGWALASPATVAGDWTQPMTTPGIEAKGMTVGEVLRGYIEPLGGAVVADIVTGKFHLFTPEQLAGSTPTETVQVADQLDDIKWSTDASEIRSAVDVNYRVVSWQKVKTAKELWKADSPLPLPTTQTVQVSDPVGFATPDVEIHPNKDGSGALVGRRYSATETIPGTWDLSFDDTLDGGGPTWAVTADGEPSARLITNWPGTWLERTLRVGAAETDTDVLSVDGGPAVQTAGVAAEVASRLQSLVSIRRWTIDRVQVVVDLRRRVGDVIELVYDDEDRGIHLSCRAVITGITPDYDSSGIAQYLSLAVCPGSFGDLDEFFAGHGLETFGDLDTFLTAAGVGATFGDLDDYLRENT